jgi:hypothetical protein
MFQWDKIVHHRYSADERILAIYFTNTTFGLVADTHEATTKNGGLVDNMNISYSSDGRIVMIEFIDVDDCASISQRYDPIKDELTLFLGDGLSLLDMQQTFDPKVFISGVRSAPADIARQSRAVRLSSNTSAAPAGRSPENGYLKEILIKDASKSIVMEVSTEEIHRLEMAAIGWNAKMVDKIQHTRQH